MRAYGHCRKPGTVGFKGTRVGCVAPGVGGVALAAGVSEEDAVRRGDAKGRTAGPISFQALRGGVASEFKRGLLLAKPPPQEALFPRTIERVTQLGSARLVDVPNTSEAAWVQDAQGREWVVKWEEETGVEGLLAEAVCWLLGRELGVPQPPAAVFIDAQRRGWLSGRIPSVIHWDAGKAHFITNPDGLGAILALDAITFNDDRHRRNILLQPDPDELHLRAWAIDSGNALVGTWPDFAAKGLTLPSTRNLAKGLPIDGLRAGAAIAASRASALGPARILAIAREACEIAREPSPDPLVQALRARLSVAESLTTDYLDLIWSLS